MTFLEIGLSAIFVITFFRNLFAYLHLWWVKEYRFDRMLIHLKTDQGQRWWWPNQRIPRRSPKTMMLIVLGMSVFGFVCLFLPFDLFPKLVLLNLLLFPLTFVLVFLVNLPTRIYHWLLIQKAVRKIRQHQQLLVIGVTGSYGKTSVKDFLATILSVKYRVLKTEASKNSPIAIAEVILKDLQPDHQIFVVEMGAYKQGEIAFMSRMVKPQIGIVTAINAQHQDLFGSLENTMKAKYELVANLVSQKIAIFNADNTRTKTMSAWAKKDGRNVWLYSKNTKATFQAVDIKSDLQSVEFVCIQEKEKISVKATVLGEHQISNFLAALSGAVASGMTFTEACRAASQIKPTEKVMQRIVGSNGSIMINDTFNNNPEAAIAGLQFLAKSKGKKYFVFQPMIELGMYAEVSHKKVGAIAGKICDAIYLTNNNFQTAFLRGVRSSNSKTPVLFMSVKQAAKDLTQKLNKEDMVLFKGKEAENFFNLLR